MGILIRQSIASTIFIYIGAVIGFVNTTILYPKFLTESQIGALNLIVSYAIIFGFLGTFGFTKAIGKFFPYFRSKQHNHKGFVFLMIIVGSLGFALVALVFGPISDWLIERNAVKSPHFAAYIHLIIPLTFVHVFWNLFDTYNAMLYRTIYGVSLKEFWLRLIFTIGIVLVIFNYIDFQEYIYIYVGGFVVVLIALIIHLIYYGDFNVLPNISHYQKPVMRDMFSWSAYGFVTGLSGFAALKIDTIMINEFIDDAATGIYVTVFNFTTLILMPSRGMLRIASALISDAFKSNDLPKVEDMYKRTCLTQAVIATFIFLGLTVNIDNIFRILPENFILGYWVIFIIGFANIIRMMAGVSENIIALSDYYRYQTLFIIIYLFTIVVSNYILIPLYGLNGAAIASCASIAVYFLIRYIFLFVKFNFQPYNYRYLILVVVTVSIFYLLKLIPYIENLYLDILIRSVLVGVIYGGIIFWLKLSNDINSLITKSFDFVKARLSKYWKNI